MGRGAANAAALDGAIMSRQATTTKPVPYWEPAGQRSMAARAAGYGFTGVWLLYLIAPLADLFTGHYSALYQWGGLAIIVAFSAIYLFAVPNWAYAPRYSLPA